jgi:hypothetical protein
LYFNFFVLRYPRRQARARAHTHLIRKRREDGIERGGGAGAGGYKRAGVRDDAVLHAVSSME